MLAHNQGGYHGSVSEILAEQNFADLNTALIALLPKKNRASEVRHFRPISLIHSVAKLISKFLSTRLAGAISPAQTTFQKGKCIHGSFQYVQSSVKMLHRTKKKALFFKLGIAKAFDSFSWEFLLELMERMGFPPRWRDWIVLLLSTASSTCMLNGAPGPSIAHGCGFR